LNGNGKHVNQDNDKEERVNLDNRWFQKLTFAELSSACEESTKMLHGPKAGLHDLLGRNHDCKISAKNEGRSVDRLQARSNVHEWEKKTAGGRGGADERYTELKVKNKDLVSSLLGGGFLPTILGNDLFSKSEACKRKKREDERAGEG
jgi:hypothetical protein